MRPHPRRTTPFRTLLAAGVTTLLAATLITVDRTSAPSSPANGAVLAAAGNPVTPGNFTGYGFDQCLAPEQSTMDVWLKHSPFLSVGIYISGNSRACRSQPNLTTTWISSQLRKGWRLLPITLGPQASCSTRYPKYDDDPTINPDSTNGYSRAKAQGRLEAIRAVERAQALGIRAGSTLFYDLEAFDIGNTRCRESALRFLHAWTNKLHVLGYVSGYYSSAGSGIKMVDDARVYRPGQFSLPDQLWIARWDGVANTSTSYVREDGWQPHRRVKQYQGGHDERWGGVTINIDRNFLDVGRGSVAAPESRCGGVRVNFWRYDTLTPGSERRAKIKALQCLLTEQGYYSGPLDGGYGKVLSNAVKSWQYARGFTPTTTWSRPHWVSLLSRGTWTIIKFGSAGRPVRRLQRALNANGAWLSISGVFNAKTDRALRAWQKDVGIPASGVAAPNVWWRLGKGR
jgi:hypothetical protein